ncbi:carbon-nitrogen hydrolase family protein [Sphingomonas sp. 10B4]|uniref:carbon-nitrogen hydrolase family protein n=1 Tax=Sphingomonas sp. 10B4 TaxID=3048575 RepID=UPI002AB4E9AC|nr:carbon-nitrogen hydrolase family protein [Sphingomonas sp. 10B4]MDY7526303.1 carbon-nitrogen hydrolase family protein [Sphingomonas sp. 10B4]MEB0284301.1 carbon-nitrogen hydrolase family protein [Sphingomonas sp. 10B4]
MRIATVQCPAIADDAASACEAVVQRLRWATKEAIDLLVFPEAFLLGHSYDPETIRSRAHEASGAALTELCRRVAAFPVTLVVGAFDVASRHIFNSAFVIEEGQIAGRYAKVHPNEPGVTAGSDFPTFVRSAIRYGINICNDANHADPAEQIARQGAELILYPLNNMLPPVTAERWREKSLANLVDRAQQTGCWIASSDVTGASEGLLSYGCTAIVAPDGHVVARVPELSGGAAVYDVPERQLRAIIS